MDGGGLRAEWGGVSGCVVQHGEGGVWEWWCRSADETRCEGYAASEGEAKHVVGVMLRTLEVLTSPERPQQITEVMRVTIEHGEDDLREWLTRSGYRATLDRRSVASVVEAERGCARGCEVGLQSGSLWLLDAPYAEVVAWWRGDAPALTADCVAEWEVGP